jgi:hypothetical protein
MEVANETEKFLAAFREHVRALETHPLIVNGYTAYARRKETTQRTNQRVYFIKAVDGHIKIGIAVDPERRLASLQTAHAKPLHLLGSCPGGHFLEVALHLRFARDRVHGEWFRPSDELLAKIAELIGPESLRKRRPRKKRLKPHNRWA